MSDGRNGFENIVYDLYCKKCSLSRREESCKNKLFACLLVCPQGQKNARLETMKISILVLSDGLVVGGVGRSVPPPRSKEHFKGQKNIFQKSEIIHNSE